MQIDRRRLVLGILGAAVAGAFLLLPALSLVGSLLAPSQPKPATTHVPMLLGEAIWARGLGGRATELQPLNPFTIARMASCHLLAERSDDQNERNAQHDECFKLIPAVQAIGYLATVHMRSEGVWQDPRVPFVQIATVTKLSSTWTRAELLDTLAERGEFPLGFVGVESASRGYFGRSAAELALPQAALLGSMIGENRIDPWCNADRAAALRRRVLERMRDNLAIDDAAMELANRSELGLSAPPFSHKPCVD
ncbi:MAG: transglycosylase domain-containing protein [Vicinamibacterales bacterium]